MRETASSPSPPPLLPLLSPPLLLLAARCFCLLCDLNAALPAEFTRYFFGFTTYPTPIIPAAAVDADTLFVDYGKRVLAVGTRVFVDTEYIGDGEAPKPDVTRLGVITKVVAPDVIPEDADDLEAAGVTYCIQPGARAGATAGIRRLLS